MQSWLNSLDDSNSGSLIFDEVGTDAANPTRAQFKFIAGAVEDLGGTFKITVTYESGTLTFSNGTNYYVYTSQDGLQATLSQQYNRRMSTIPGVATSGSYTLYSSSSGSVTDTFADATRLYFYFYDKDGNPLNTSYLKKGLRLKIFKSDLEYGEYVASSDVIYSAAATYYYMDVAVQAAAGTISTAVATVTLYMNIPGMGACFIKGTSIATPSGPKPIEQIKDGDNVYCFDDNQALQLGVVHEKVYHRDKRDIIEVN